MDQTRGKHGYRSGPLTLDTIAMFEKLNLRFQLASESLFLDGHNLFLRSTGSLALRDDRLLQLSPWTQGELFAELSLEVAPLLDLHGSVRRTLRVGERHCRHIDERRLRPGLCAEIRLRENHRRNSLT